MNGLLNGRFWDRDSIVSFSSFTAMVARISVVTVVWNCAIRPHNGCYHAVLFNGRRYIIIVTIGPFQYCNFTE